MGIDNMMLDVEVQMTRSLDIATFKTEQLACSFLATSLLVAIQNMQPEQRLEVKRLLGNKEFTIRTQVTEEKGLINGQTNITHI